MNALDRKPAPRVIGAGDFRALFDRDEEFAVLDTRELSDFYRGHLLSASPAPLSRIELLAPRLVPRLDTLVVLTDWASARESHEALTALGYTNVAVMEGGLAGWHLAGGRVYPGWNVQGKAFGAYCETALETPTITADELAAMLEKGQPPLIIDTRNEEEHVDYCIPGAILCANQEMIYRAVPMIKALDDPGRPVVTHCAGRTRGIMGARALIDAGLENPVMSLAKGTLEWTLAGYQVEHGAHRKLEAPTDASAAISVAARLAEKHGVEPIDEATLQEWRKGAERTLYLFDIRAPEDVACGTLPGAAAVPGVKLQQGVDEYIATRNARIVLVDTDGVRAVQVGAVLRQMGHRHVYSLTVEPAALTSTPSAPKTGGGEHRLDDFRNEERFTLADIRGGVAYRRGHVAGSWCLSRRNLEFNLGLLPANTDIVLISDDAQFAALVDRDMKLLGRHALTRCDPLEDWEKAGFAIESGVGRLAGEPSDAIYDLEDRDVHIRDSHEYLDWLTSLFHTLAGDPAAPYMPANTGGKR